jgi:hypothetical protein
LNFGLPLAGGFSFFSASCGADVFSLAFLFFDSSYFGGMRHSSAALSLFYISLFEVAPVFIMGFFLLAEFSRD